MVTYSLAMDVVFVDGVWWVDAGWLEEPVSAPSWAEAYWKAIAARSER